MEKIIFLDCDGVIATSNSKFKLDKEKCDLIQKIVDATGAKIVISSSWRLSFFVDTLKLFQFGLWIDGKPDRRFSFTPSWAYEIIGQTPHCFVGVYNSNGSNEICSRGLEIQQWIEKNIRFIDPQYENISSKDFRYVILDDNNDMLLCQKDNFIKTNIYTGITKEQVEEAIKILNS